MLPLIASLSSQYSLLQQGDQLWCEDKYKEAMSVWRDVADEQHSGLKALVEYRLMLGTSNMTWMINGLKGDQALMDCAPEDPLCVLARIDRELIFDTIGFPADLAYATELLPYIESALPEAHQNRSLWLNQIPNTPESLNSSGFGTCFTLDKTILPIPQRTSISFGGFATKKQGLGGSIFLSLPNLNGFKYTTSISISTKSSGHMFHHLESTSTYWFFIETMLRRGLYYQYIVDQYASFLIDHGNIRIAPGYRWETGSAWLGAELRWDEGLDKASRGHGVIGGVFWHPNQSWNWSHRFNATWLDYQHFRWTQTLSYVSNGPAIRISTDLAPNSEAPWWRLPTAGGGQLLRIATLQRFRSDLLLTSTVEWRFLRDKMIGFVVFSETAYTPKTTYFGSGVGIRLRTSPDTESLLSLDFGYGTTGPNVYLGVGEFF
ncbi:MAG: hypothetical protein CMK59_13815 [Proteobacteria bacterium]|nr:hypothetical protein [Pseudomonadota bacterium]